MLYIYQVSQYMVGLCNYSGAPRALLWISYYDIFRMSFEQIYIIWVEPTIRVRSLIIQNIVYIFQLIMNKLLLLEIPCPLCMESKSALMQTCSGVFLPLILIPFANFSVRQKWQNFALLLFFTILIFF